ncbi:inositol monophosphatase family protein [Bacillota bacterium Meth-B3]
MFTADMRTLTELVRSVKAIVMDERNVTQREEKGAFDYVTMVDLEVQKHISGALTKLYPDCQFMGEEGQHLSLDLDRPTWILDPIDGTTNLIHHHPQCAVALALMVRREIALGIIYSPFTDQLFTAERGKGAFLNNRPIRVSQIRSLSGSLVSVGTTPYHKQYARSDFAVMADIFQRCQDIRRGGSAALDIASVAMGIADCFYERILMPWDYAAAKVLLEEAAAR